MRGKLTVDHKENKIIMDRTFAKFEKDTFNEKYAHLQQIRRDCPTYRVELRTIKKNPNKESYKGLTYEYIVCMWDGKEGFDFLGMHHRRMTTETKRGNTFQETYQYPSRKAVKKMKTAIKSNVNSRSLLVASEEDLIKSLSPKITGWRNYYTTKTSDKWMQALDWYIIWTFTRWYNKKHQRRNHMSRVGYVRNNLYGKGLKRMATAWRNAVERRMSESCVRENLMHGLMRWKRAKPSNPTLLKTRLCHKYAT